ncbi:MAG: Holliday junction branch migration protein RuvA [Negativicutes bacterium]|nr:Holliday junction branch migration protein RuvA [Negativicutes bacterium]
MLAYIRGKIIACQGGVCVVEVGGFGLRLFTPVTEDYQRLKLNETIFFYTHLHQKEDGSSLYGFLTEEEQKLFLLLISVAGIGPKNGLNILSFAPPSQIYWWLVNEDVAQLKKAPGIGVKTAQRLILELKNKVGSLNLNPPGKTAAFAEGVFAESAAGQAIEALIALGYDQREATKQINFVLETKPDAAVELLIKDALRLLMRF